MRHYPFLISVIAGALWVVGFSVVTYLAGVRPRPRPQEHSGALQRLSRACLYGALGWGVGMFIASLVDDYLEGKLSSSPLPLTGHVVIYLSGGCLFGWMMWGEHKDKTLPPGITR